MTKTLRTWQNNFYSKSNVLTSQVSDPDPADMGQKDIFESLCKSSDVIVALKFNIKEM